MNEKEYYQGLRDVIQRQYEGDATWSDVVDFRESNGVKTTYDYVQRGCAMLMEFLRAGYTLMPPNSDDENSEFTENNVTDFPGCGLLKSVETYDGSKNITTYDDLIEIFEGETLTPQLIMEHHHLSPLEWKITSYSNGKWHSLIKGGKRLVQYKSKLCVKPINNGIDMNAVSEHFKNFVPEYSKTIKKANHDGGNKLLVPALYDVHFGKMGWHGEVGEGENYDLNIAKERFLKNSKAYIERVKGQKFEKVLYVIGQDFIHSEPDGNTVNNTKQDCDGRYQKIFTVACEALIESIMDFKEIAPVDVVLVQGNHAENSEFFMAELLKAYFRNDDDITVDSSPMLRKYYRFHNNLLGLSHGEYEGKRIAELMPVEARSDWGETEYHEFLLGHLHHESSLESTGVTIRRIPSICGVDAWSKKMGYCMSPKRSVAFVYDAEHGLVDTMYQPVE